MDYQLTVARDADPTAPSPIAPGLTVGEQRFCEEVMKDQRPWHAAVRAGLITNATRGVDFTIGDRLLKDPRLQPYLQQCREITHVLAMVEPATVLREQWTIATADASELTRVTKRACRHCYGVDFAYQFKHEREFATQFAKASAELERWEDTKPSLRTTGRPALPEWPADGKWFDWKADPNDDCPECEGQGVQQLEVADMRRISPAARRLFAGIKPTNAGLEIKMRDQDAAMRSVAAAIGMITEGHGVSVPGTSRAITRDDLSRLTPDELDRMIELSEKLTLDTSAGGGSDEMAPASERVDSGADPARLGSTGTTEPA